MLSAGLGDEGAAEEPRLVSGKTKGRETDSSVGLGAAPRTPGPPPLSTVKRPPPTPLRHVRSSPERDGAGAEAGPPVPTGGAPSMTGAAEPSKEPGMETAPVRNPATLLRPLAVPSTVAASGGEAELPRGEGDEADPASLGEKSDSSRMSARVRSTPSSAFASSPTA